MGRRISAAIIELTIWGILFLIAALIFGQRDVLKTVSTTTNAAGQTVDQGQSLSYQSNLTGLPFVIFQLIGVAYYIFFEWYFGGTLSKLILGLKVVSLDGKKLSLKQSLIRNLSRIVDAFPYAIPYLVGLITLSTNPNKQRLGDKLAHTLVIRK